MVGQSQPFAAGEAELARETARNLLKKLGWPALMLLLLPVLVFAQVGPPVTPGFPNVPQTAGDILSGINAPNQGRTAIIAYHNGILFTMPESPGSLDGSDLQARTWDITNPASPVEIEQLGVTTNPINAHGYLKIGEFLMLGNDFNNDGPWAFQSSPTPMTVIRSTYPDLLCSGVRGCLFQPWFVGQTFWSYGDVSGNATLSRDFIELSNWDHLGMTGVIGHPFLLGDLVIFASDQSRTGIATYSVADPANPVLLDVLTTGGAGGYWPELWGGDGRLYAVFPYRTAGNGIRVVDLTDPSDMQFVADVPLPGDEAMYIQFQDEFAFTGDHKVDMRTFESVLFLDSANTEQPNQPGVFGLSTSQFALPIGNLLVTGGIGPNQGMAIWAHQDEPDTRGPSVGFHRPGNGHSNYPVGLPISVMIHETLESYTIVNGETFIVRPLGGSAIAGQITLAFDDILTFTPDADLQDNTTYEVVIPAGGIKDAAGNGIEGYSFTFSTGAAVGGNQQPEITAFDVSVYPVAASQQITLTTTASDPDMDSLEYRFDYGDGRPKSAWSSSNSIMVSYDENGHYRATAQVRDPSGSLASLSSTVTVASAPPAVLPTQSSPLACGADVRRSWAVNPDNSTLTAISMDSLAVEFEVPTCTDPRSVARAGGQLWLSCYDADVLQVLNESTGAEIDSIDVGYGSGPMGVVASPDGNNIYVTLQNRGQLQRYDRASRQLTGSVDLGRTPHAVAISADGATALVSRHLSDINHAELWRVDTASMMLDSTIRIEKYGNEANRDTTASGRGVANYLSSIAIAPDGNSAWVTATKPNSERGLFFVEDLDTDNTQRTIAVQIDLGTNEVLQTIDLDNSDSASFVTFSPLGDYLLIALQGNDSVLYLDNFATESAVGFGALTARHATGAAPQGLCLDSQTNRTFVKDFLGRSITTVESNALFEFGMVSMSSSETATVASESLAADVLLGKQIFYDASDPRMSAEGYISCASCHLDGGHDGRVWDFTGRGEGFRNTTSLRGRRGTGHGNVHWSANFDEIQDFEHDIRGPFGGTGFMSDADFAATGTTLGPPKAGLSADLDALAAYVSSLDNSSLPRSPFRNSNGSQTAAADNGELVFNSSGCGSCHVAPDFTDSDSGPSPLLTNIGTQRTSSGQRLGGPLEGIDTPTLLGVWRTAPYFHDGSAPALEDVFTVAGGVQLQAEDGVMSGGASASTDPGNIFFNHDNTVHQGGFANLTQQNAQVSFNNVDGGSGGSGAIEIRYSSSYGVHPLEITVNGFSQVVNPPVTGNIPQFRFANWETLRVEGFSFNPGNANTVSVRATNQFAYVGLDDVLVTADSEHGLAAAHRVALSLSAGDRADLLAFLRQLDGVELVLPDNLFSDGFE